MDPEDTIPRLDSAELEKARAKYQTESPLITPPPSSRARVPREDESAPRSVEQQRSEQPPASHRSDQPPRSERYGSRPTNSWTDEAPSGPRSRKPLTVDTVGDAATRIARTTRQTSPKVVATKSMIASAPLDSRSAFVLSHVDGTSDVPAIVDGTGMSSEEVIGILARLARLGLISVPTQL